MIISVDHGNKSIKTPHLLFTSGLVESENQPGIKTDCIFWDGKYYSLTEKRISYLRDKTEDDRFFVLTLFAIAKELEYAGIKEPDDTVDVTLLIGLPPAHYGQLHARFEQYFLRKREVVDFEYNGRYYSIRIGKVVSYRSCLKLASEHELQSVAFCCISTGEFHFPNQEAARIAVQTVKEFLQAPTTVRKVIFNVFKDIDAKIYNDLL